MKRILFLQLGLLFFIYSYCQDCPDYGDATTAEKKTFNKKKNKKINVPSSWQAEFLPLKNLLPKKQRDEKDLYWEGAYVYTEGYMTSAEEQGPESCNCKEASESKKNGDVHMYLSLVKDAPKKNSMVVEITPLFKKKFPDYKQYMKKNIKIRVYGFLFYDTEHEDAAFTTCNSCGHIWRKTNWEIHPITEIEIIEEQ
jgi:hypothetical protein